jgi:hypothetical protein
MAEITTIFMLKNTAVGTGSAGGTNSSDIIDLRDINRKNNFTLSYRVGAAGAVSTAATVNFKYLLSYTKDGTFAAPITGDKGTIGTAGSGAAGSCGLIGFTPVIAPFMKILAIAGTSGTALVSTELHVQ